MNGLVAFVSGLLFACGLGLAGMTRPEKVLAFLDVAGAWDPTLALVMVAAIAVHAPVAWWALRRRAPLLGDRYELPARRDVDGALVAGAALFGVGWGLGGYCPGPALVSLVAGAPGTELFVAAMVVGMGVHRLVR